VYAPCGDLSLAYQVFGDGPVEVVFCVELRGVPGSWQLLEVDPHGAQAGSAEAQLASAPTPGPRTAMRRTDRAVAVMAKRTPWILRGVARVAPVTGRS
jgi:hypothetical protein